MGLRIKPLGEYLYQIDARNANGELEQDAVRGIATSKVFISTKANLNGVSLSNYKIVPPRSFAYVPDTSRRGDKISLAFNDSNDRYLVSSISVVFGIKEELECELMPEYLYLYFNRPEFDRYARFNSWGSAREAFSWEDLCSTEFAVPDIDVQKNCVNVFQGMQENLDSLTKGVEQMQRTCDVYMERLIKTSPKQAIGNYITQTDERNDGLTYTIDDVRGISIEKRFIETKANMQGVSLRPYKIIKPNDFCYVTVTSRNGDKISIALNESDSTYIVSSSYVSFRVTSKELLPEYLFMFLRRPDFDRFSRFNSWGSAREVLALDDLGRFEIPVPDVDIQQDIINIFTELNRRKRLLEQLTTLQKNLCPILIRGAAQEGGQ